MIRKKSLLFAFLCFVLVSCAPHKKVVILAPSAGSEKGIVYKSASDEVNERIKGYLMAALNNLSAGFFTGDLARSPVICGPILWGQVKSAVPVNDSIGVPLTVLIPNLDPNERGKTEQAEARVIREDGDLVTFFSLFDSLLDKPDSFVIRKLTEPEKSLYWAFISWDIEEPVYAVEAGSMLLIMDLMESKNKWKLFYLEDISPMIERWKSAMHIHESQEKVHELAKADNTTGAKAVAQKSLEESEKLYGKKHKKYGMALSSLANVYAQEGDFAEAESLYIKAANVFIDVLGVNNTYLVGIYNNLSNLYDCQSRYDESELALKKAINIYEGISGDEGGNAAILYASLASNYKNRKKYDLAVKTHETAVKLFEKEMGRDNPNIAIEYSNFGECYFDLKKYDQADIYYKKSENVLLKTLGPDHNVTIGIRANVARNLVYLKKYSEAEPLLLRAIEYKLQKSGKIHRSLLESVESLGKLYRETGDSVKADEYESWAKEIREKTKPESSCNIVPDL
jgi:tetratricopeptide (TPR) repeat protein